MFKGKYSFYLLLFALFTLVSCKTMDMVFHPSNYIKKDESPIVKEIVYDTMVVYLDADEGIKKAKAGLPRKQIMFTKIGQSFTFKSGDIVQVVYDGIDVSNASLEAKINEDTKEIALSLVPKREPVRLTCKCQISIRLENEIPKIEVGEGMLPEQIILTPVFNDKCEQVGDEIRYGSTERGCAKMAQKTLEKFRNCSGQKKRIKIKRLKDLL